MLDGNIMLRWHLWVCINQEKTDMTTVIELSIGPGISDPFTSIHVYLNAGEQTCTVGVPKSETHEGKGFYYAFSNVIESNCSRGVA